MTAQYGLKSTNLGWKMLAGLGWKEGDGLGREGEGRKVPVRAWVREGRGGLAEEKKGAWIDKRKEDVGGKEKEKIVKAKDVRLKVKLEEMQQKELLRRFNEP
ncbi:hypothetical protein BT69DRAFT_1280287, partial [Atractiella rhizophila]